MATRRGWLVLAGAMGLLFIARGGAAHHSFAAEFDINRPISLKGSLTKMDWVNPHGWIYIDVKGADGKIVNWAVETDAPNALLRRGLRQADFKIGVEITVDGFAAKNGTSTMTSRNVKLPDGRDFFSVTGRP